METDEEQDEDRWGKQEFDADMEYERARDSAGDWLEENLKGFLKSLEKSPPQYYKDCKEKLLRHLRDIIDHELSELDPQWLSELDFELHEAKPKKAK